MIIGFELRKDCNHFITTAFIALGRKIDCDIDLFDYYEWETKEQGIGFRRGWNWEMESWKGKKFGWSGKREILPGIENQHLELHRIDRLIDRICWYNNLLNVSDFFLMV